MQQDEPDRKLNIFALPNQTIILVVLLACVLYGALIAIGASVRPVVFWFLAFGLAVISFRGLLSWPERECARNKLAPASGDFAPLQELITRLARELALRRTPLLMLSPGNGELCMFGSWRRWYITMGEARARTALQSLDDDTQAHMIEAALLHELCHFKHGDNVWTGYARALLRAGLWLMGWATIVLIGIVSLLSQVQETFFLRYSPPQVARRFDAIMPGSGEQLAEMIFGSTEQWQQVRDQSNMIDLGQLLFNYFFNTFALTLFGGGLLLVFWQRLMRTREIYADAGVAHAQGRIGPLLSSIFALGSTTSATENADAPQPFTQAVVKQAQVWWQWVHNKFITYHPTFEERKDYLREPQRIYGNWRPNALLIGYFTLVLDLLLLGSSASFYATDWPLHVPILIAFILIALTILTPIAMGQPIGRDILKIIGAVTFIRLMMLLLNLAILIANFIISPALLERLLEIWGNAIIGYSGLSPDASDIDLGAFVLTIIRVNLLLVLIVSTTLLLASWLNAILSRRILTWYGFPAISLRVSSKIQITLTLMRVIYLVLVLLVILLAFAVLPLITDLVSERATLDLALTRLAVTGGTLLLVLPVAIWLWRCDRRYAGRCPHCGETIPGYYYLARRCEKCGQTLNPWLLVTYDAERIS